MRSSGSRVQALKSLGLPLAAIAGALAQPKNSIAALIEAQLERADAELARATQLRERLRQLRETVRAQPSLSMDTLLQLIEATAMFEKHFTPDQLHALEQRKQTLAPGAIEAAQQEWPQLIAKMREKMQAGADPAGAEVQALARRWRELVQMFTGGDAGIAQSVSNLYQQEPQARAMFGLDAELMGYVKKAMG
jgi:hypothetical protein